MNKNKKSVFMLLPIFILIGLFLNSCGIDDSINNSPNAINTEKVKSVDGIQGLTIAMQVAASDWYCGDRSRISSIWTWQMCAPDGLGRSQPVAWNSYSMEEVGPTNDMWTLAYRGVRLANDIIEFTPQVNFGIDNIMQQNYFLGMAKAYKALFFGELAAFYGSIPINIEGLAPPIFVTQTEAYTEAQKLLDEALVHFAASIPTDRDLNYYSDGDADVAKANWTATIHSLKARFFLHLKKYSEALAESKMGITDPTVGLFAQYSDAASEHSPWGHWTYTEVGEPIRGEASFVRLLKAEAGDTRLAEYFTPNDGTNFWGFAQQEAEIDSNELMTDKIVSLNKYGHYADIFPFITYQENMFIKAECEFETGDQASAANDLNLMRTAVGLPDYSGSELRNEIMKQKYLQLFLEGQSYHDMRRLGTLPSTEIPKRWIYPINEKNANPNVPADNVGLVKDILP